MSSSAGINRRKVAAGAVVHAAARLALNGLAARGNGCRQVAAAAAGGSLLLRQ